MLSPVMKVFLEVNGMRKKKMSPQSYANGPLTGVGLLSGFGAPDDPPRYDLKEEKKAVPKEDTHPGTGLRHLDGRVEDPDGRVMLGEID